MQACDASLRRLGADHSDLWHLHAFDALTPLDETLRAGKVRYVLRDAATDRASSLVIGARN